MTVADILSRVNSLLGQTSGNKFITGATSDNGSSDGTTFVATGLNGVDDAYNEMEFKQITGFNAGQRRLIGDWVNSTGTGTLIEPMTNRIDADENFQIGEKGVVSDHEIIEFMNLAQEQIASDLAPDVFGPDLLDLEVAVSAGVSSSVLPDTFVGTPKMGYFRTGSSVQHDIEIISNAQRNRVNDDPFSGQDNDSILVWFQAGRIYTKPLLTGTLVFPVVPVFSEISYGTALDMPSWLHYLIVIFATGLGYKEKKQFDSAALQMSEYRYEIDKLNKLYVNSIRQVN